LSILDQVPHLKIDYVGVDLSSQILSHAKKVASQLPGHISCSFVCDDITHWISTTHQESFDLVVGIASFHHLPSPKDRLFVLKHIYKLLSYEGWLLLTNRSLSSWVISSYRKAFIKSCFRFFFSRGKLSRRDLFVPWKTKEKTYQRYYHFFSLNELRNLLIRSGFVVDKLHYMNTQGQKTDHRFGSKNSFLLAKKSVLQK
jgi:SAM-dependent methyltransferase